MVANIFQPARTLLYLKKYVFENGRSFILLNLAIAAFLVLWLGVYLNFTNPNLFSERAQVAYYFITLFLSGCLSAGVLFSELGSKDRSIHYFLIPASLLEKFLTSLFFAIVIFFISSSCIFWLVDSIVVIIANSKYETHWEVINLLSLNKYANPFFDGPLTDIFYFYFPAQALFILCSVYFRKYALFKAFVVVGLLWVVGVLLFLAYQRLVPTGMLHLSAGSYEVLEANGDNKMVVVPWWVLVSGSVLLRYLLTPLLLTVAYFRLKEKEL
ncbi:hypothetical protein WBG78_06435 [Chryseolinea sp. T2]|uniref:hypothetical protein n=1 Tax=Chryseolinea sp. T2 TaxID=3129255 RepID=UPI00307794CE